MRTKDEWADWLLKNFGRSSDFLADEIQRELAAERERCEAETDDLVRGAFGPIGLMTFKELRRCRRFDQKSRLGSQP